MYEKKINYVFFLLKNQKKSKKNKINLKKLKVKTMK